MMKKTTHSRARAVFYVLVVTATVLYLSGLLVLRSLAARGTYLYLGLARVGVTDLLLEGAIVLGVLVIVAVTLLLRGSGARRLWKVLGTCATVCAVVLLVGTMLIAAGFSPRAYVELTSEDGAHRVVVAEDAYVFSPYGGDVYELTSDTTMRRIGRYETAAESDHPFSDGRFEAVWQGDTLELHYDDSYGGDYATLTVELLGESEE